jgi:hypothetical protein
MSGKKWNIYLSMGLLMSSFAMMLFAGSLVRPGNVGAYVLQTQRRSGGDYDSVLKEAVEASYDISFAFPRRGMDNAALYIPDYDFIEKHQAELYLRFLGIGDSSPEDDGDGAFYIFKGTDGELHVNKHYNRIIARFNNPLTNQSFELDEESALQKALDFMDKTPLPFDYALSAVHPVDGGWSAVFYRDIGGLICRDHPVRITMDDGGNIVSMDYYRLTYEKIASVSLITMKDAYYSLPPLSDELKADLKKCTLVYRFEDSILQPAFYFEGEIVQEQDVVPFSYYVNASKFY